MCIELIAKIAKMKSKYSADSRGWDDDDDGDGPSEWTSVNVTVIAMIDHQCWLFGSC